MEAELQKGEEEEEKAVVVDDDDDDDDDEVLTRAYFIALKCIPSGGGGGISGERAEAVLTNGEGSESVCTSTDADSAKCRYIEFQCDLHYFRDNVLIHCSPSSILIGMTYLCMSKYKTGLNLGGKRHVQHLL